MKKCKECGREEIGYGSLLDEDGYCFLCGLKHSKEKIKRLKEQLNEANELLKAYGTESLWESLSLSCDEANEYCKKWGVK